MTQLVEGIGPEEGIDPSGYFPDAVMLTSGNYVVSRLLIAFETQLQIYLGDGTLLGAPISIPAVGYHRLAALEGGGFVLFYTTNTEARARIFDESGVLTSGDLLLGPIDYYSGGIIGLTELANGGFAAAWRNSGTTTVKTFDAAGNPAATLATNIPAEATGQEVIELDGGKIAVIWHEYDSVSPFSGGYPDGYQVSFQLFAADGTALTTKAIINQSQAGSHAQPRAAALAGGGFVVTWVTNGTAAGDGAGINAQIYDANGVPVGSNVKVSDLAPGWQSQPDVAPLSWGGFLVSWSDSSSGNPLNFYSGIRAQLFDSVGNRVGQTIQVNQQLFADEVTSTILITSDNEARIFYRASAGGTANPSGIVERVIALPDVGTTGDDLLTGSAGADRISGLSGDDVINGGDGDDALGGDSGNDILNGNGGIDSLFGGEGDDYLSIDFGDSADGGIGTDRIFFAFYTAPALNIDLSALWAGGSVTIGGGTLSGFEKAAGLYGSDFGDTIVMGTGYTQDDVFQGSPGIYGRGGNDSITGGGGKDQLSGDEGDDQIYGLGNDDSLYGGIGSDQIDGGDGNDQIYAGTGNDIGLGGLGSDSMYGDDGDDNLSGGDGSDTLVGDAGNDTLNGGNGNDYITGGAGIDVVDAGDGDDNVEFSTGDTVDGGAGANQLMVNLRDSTGPTSLDLSTLWSGGIVTSATGSIRNFTYLHSFNASDFDDLFIAGTSATNGFTAWLSGGHDILVAGSGNDAISFGTGSHTATGGGGADTYALNGGTGAVTDFELGLDRIVLQLGIVNLDRLYDLNWAQVGSDTSISFDSGGVHSEIVLQNVALGNLTPDSFQIFTNYEQNLSGTAFTDRLYGSYYNDVIHGAGGNDRIYSGGGKDKLYGDAGDDTIVLDGAIGPVPGTILDGGADNDTLLLRSPAQSNSVNGFGVDLFSASLTGFEVIKFDSKVSTTLQAFVTAGQLAGVGRIEGGAGTDSLVVVLPDGGGVFSIPALSMSNWSGSDLLQVKAGSGGNYTINLGAHNGGGYSAIGGAGNDILDGSGGLNSLTGEAGNDRLVLSAGSGSSVDGGADTDTLAISGAVSLGSITGIEAIELANGAALTLTGAQFASGLASNSVLSGVGSIIVNVTAGTAFTASAMTLAGGSSIGFTVNGSTGDDIIKAFFHGANTINGGFGNDQIRGGLLVDTISGGDGNDKILGFSGADVLTGGAGNDQFRYLFASDSGIGTAADRITDFLSGTDRLNFALLDADPVAAGRQALTYIDTAAFTASGTAQARYGVSGADLLVQVDLDGNGTADMEIVLLGAGTQTLSSGDFML